MKVVRIVVFLLGAALIAFGLTSLYAWLGISQSGWRHVVTVFVGFHYGFLYPALWRRA